MASFESNAADSGGSGDIMSQINVTPLVDVLLVLLLVLMVSASAAVARALDVSLPAAASGTTLGATLSIRVDRDGVWRVGDLVLGAPELRQKLSELGPPDALSVVIAADGATQHRHVVEIMDVLARQKITRIAFAVQALDPAP
jgi:biopolymer transport protein ExbD